MKAILLIVFCMGLVLTGCVSSVKPIPGEKTHTPIIKETITPSSTPVASLTRKSEGAGQSPPEKTSVEATPTIEPSLTPSPSPIHLPQIHSGLKPICIPQDTFAKCKDELLNIEFEYPIAWGEIEAVLRTGGYTGYAYDYYYGGRTTAETEPLVAGGRSTDFTEGRGGMPTDFRGFDDLETQDRCAQVQAFYPLCQEVKPDVVWMMRFPDSHYFCEQLSAEEIHRFTFQPVVRIEINLPQNPTIHGFVFEAPFLSEALTQELDRDLFPLLSVNPDLKTRKCDPESRAVLDLAVQGFVARVESGLLDTETLENLSELRHLAASITALPASLAGLPDADQVVFTIPNAEPWSGREGDPRPDWKGWGAETFSVAPDGMFWIADTAVHPNRLLKYSPQGDLLQENFLPDRVVYVYDLAVTQDSVWVLDVAAQQPQVVQLNLAGDFLYNVDIPEEIMGQDGMLIGNGAFDLILGEEGELLLNTINGYYELVDDSGEFGFQPLEQRTGYGHTYRTGLYEETTGKIPIYIDEVLLEPSPEFFVEVESFSGFNRDGSFALAGYVLDADGQADHQVRHYDAAGNQLGMARQYPQTFYKDWNHHLAFGPDGAVYQLLSNPDHSVQVVRLEFQAQHPAPSLLPPVIARPLTALQPIQPVNTEAEQAQNTLVHFFDELSKGNYAQAAESFEGKVDDYLRDPLPDESLGAYWEYLCTYLWCLQVAEITEVDQISEGEYLFYVVFMLPDGSRFEIGACCGGDPAATPPAWQFAYPVKKVDGIWKVTRAPLFTP